MEEFAISQNRRGYLKTVDIFLIVRCILSTYGRHLTTIAKKVGMRKKSKNIMRTKKMIKSYSKAY